jgi:hypothetical protein
MSTNTAKSPNFQNFQNSEQLPEKLEDINNNHSIQNSIIKLNIIELSNTCNNNRIGNDRDNNKNKYHNKNNYKDNNKLNNSDNSKSDNSKNDLTNKLNKLGKKKIFLESKVHCFVKNISSDKILFAIKEKLIKIKSGDIVLTEIDNTLVRIYCCNQSIYVSAE